MPSSISLSRRTLVFRTLLDEHQKQAPIEWKELNVVVRFYSVKNERNHSINVEAAKRLFED